MSLHWDDLKVFLAAARGGSLARAAVLLGMDQSTVSRRLSGLEAALGLTLFKRSKTGLALTEGGTRLLPEAEAVEAGMRQFTELARQSTQAGPSGLVRLLGNPWMLALLSERVLPGVLDRYPNIEVRLLGHVPSQPVVSDATISLWFEARPQHGDVVIPLGDVPFAFYAARDKDPAQLEWVSFFDEDAPDRAPVRYWNRHRGAEDRLRLTVNDAGLILAALRSGAGKGLVPMVLGEREETLVQIDTDAPRLSRRLHVHVHPDTQDTDRVKAMLACLKADFDRTFLPGPHYASSSTG